MTFRVQLQRKGPIPSVFIGTPVVLGASKSTSASRSGRHVLVRTQMGDVPVHLLHLYLSDGHFREFHLMRWSSKKG